MSGLTAIKLAFAMFALGMAFLGAGTFICYRSWSCLILSIVGVIVCVFALLVTSTETL